MLLAFLLGTSGSALGAYDYSSPEVHSGNFLLWEIEASAEWPLELADPTKEIGVWVYDEALGVPVYVTQNPWTFNDSTGLFMQMVGDWLYQEFGKPPNAAKYTDTVVSTTHTINGTLSVAPGLGKVADAADAAIYAAEGKYDEAALTLVGGSAGKVLSKGKKVVNGIAGGLEKGKGAKNVATASQVIASKADDTANVASASTRATKEVTEQAATAAPKNTGTTWNNGWRTADGKFASPNGAGRSGAAAEQSVWDAVSQKPGWSVIQGNVGVRNASGQLRYFDGAAVSPRGRVIGLEVKSGSAVKTAAQRTFDSGVSTQNPAVGVGQNQGLQVGGTLQINR